MGEEFDQTERQRGSQDRVVETFYPGMVRVAPAKRAPTSVPSEEHPVSGSSASAGHLRPHRTRVADFWDDVLTRWIAGEDHLVPPLDRWIDAYKGTGAGEVDLGCYPDPYVGDLRGAIREPRLIVLGLNPGVGYPELQGSSGTWTERIRRSSYSLCLDRSPAEDPIAWKALHGKESPYWNRLEHFARRWLRDVDADVTDILGFELYPWHSDSVHGKMRPPPDLIDEFVWQPIGEFAVPSVFAFGAPWFDLVDQIGLPAIVKYGEGAMPMPPEVNAAAKWRLGVYQLPSGQRLVVSSQSGSASPPGEDRTEIMRDLIEGIIGGPAARPELVAVPNPQDGTWADFFEFAHTYAASQRLTPSPEQLRQIAYEPVMVAFHARSGVTVGIDLLRAALFYMARADRFAGEVDFGSPEEEHQYRWVVAQIHNRSGGLVPILDE